MKLKLLRKEKGYSYYELPAEIKEQIISFAKFDGKTVQRRRGDSMQTLTFVKQLRSGNFMYEEENGDVTTLDQELIDIFHKERIEKELNKAFNVSKFLNENVLPLIAGNQFVLAAHQNDDVIHDLNRGYETVKFMGGFGYRKLGVSVNKHGSLGFFGFNSDGEFYNRDYNLDLSQEPTDVKTFQQAIDETLNEIDGFTNILKNSKNTFFVESKNGKYALIPMNGCGYSSYEVHSGFEVKPWVREGVYYEGKAKYKTAMTGKEIPATIEDIKEVFLTGIDNCFKEEKTKYENINCKS